MKRISLLIIALLLVVSLLVSGCSAPAAVAPLESTQSDTQPSVSPEISAEPISTAASGAEREIKIVEDSITIDGAELSTDSGEAVFLARKTETHPEVTKEVENKVITITQPGNYRLTGQGENTQVLVDIDETITDDTTLILDKLELSCETAPAILVWSAHETGSEGTGSVTLQLADGSENIITGSHTAKDEDNGVTTKNDGAISTNVSMIVTGTGKLRVNADSEGIESKMHLTINGGSIEIQSHDDALNASEDGVSQIIINGGYITANSTFGQEGDGIDSNGYLTINGGTVFAYGNENSMDSGLDSDLGVTINGGVVVATGNMYDEVKKSDTQEFIALQLSAKTGERLTLVDEDGNAVFSFTPTYTFTSMVFSSPDLTASSYTLFQGGTAEGESRDGLTLSPASFAGGTQLQGAAGQSGGPMGGRVRPEGDEEGAMGQPPPMDDGTTPPQRPEGDAGSPPRRDAGTTSAEATTVFDLSESNVFGGVAAASA